MASNQNNPFVAAGVERMSINATGVTINNLTPAGVVHNNNSGLLYSALVSDTELGPITRAGVIANSALPTDLSGHTFDGQQLVASAFSDTTDADNITTGTLSDARLPTNLDNHVYNQVAINTFPNSFGLAGGTGTQVQLTVTDDIIVGGPSGSKTATLDPNTGQLYPNQLPSVAFASFLGAVENQSDLIVSGTPPNGLPPAHQGDYCVVLNPVGNWILNGMDQTVLSNWVELANTPQLVLSVAGMTGNVTLDASNIGGLANSATINATPNNTPSSIVERDNNGDFTAGTITATIDGNASGFNGLLSGDVSGTQGNTVVNLVGEVAATTIANAITGATPNAVGGSFVKRDGNGSASFANVTASLIGNADTATTAGSFTGNLSGDVTGTQFGTVVDYVGGQSAAAIASGVIAANGATSNDVGSSIVLRDSNGDFDAGNITATLLGNADSATTAISFTGNLAGDVTGTQDVTVVSYVGGVAAAAVASGATAANDATNIDTPSTLVRRDSNGNFDAGTITASLDGAASLNVLKTGDTMSGNLTLPAGTTTSPSLTFTGSDTVGAATGISAVTDTLSLITKGNQVLSINGDGVVQINGLAAPVNQTVGLLRNDANGVISTALVTDSDIATGANISDTKLDTIATAGKVLNTATTATPSNTGLAIVARDVNGDFDAGNITATLIGNADTATTATNFTGSLAGDVTGTQGATVVSYVGGQTAASVAAAAMAVTAATAFDDDSTLVARNVNGNFSANVISASLNGAASLNVLKTGDTMSGPLTVAAGTVAAPPTPSIPSLNFANSTSSGFAAASGAVSIITSGLQAMSVSAAGTVQINNLNTAGVAHTDGSGNLSTSLIVNSDISPTAAISDTKLNTISSANKVANSATTATSSNSAGAIVARDSGGNFTAGTITATLNGNASSATTAVSATSATTATTATNFTDNLAGDVTGTQGVTVVSYVGGVTAANVASGANAANAATSSSVASTIVLRDTNANFAANTITANSVTGLATPINASDAANKTYVDNAASTGINQISPAVVVSVMDVGSPPAGLQTIDSVTLIATNRVLLTGQTNGIENGVWLASSGNWTRPSDFLTGSSAARIYVLITGGVLYGGSAWLCSNQNPNAVIGTNLLTFQEFNFPSATTGNNLEGSAGGLFVSKTGNVLNFKNVVGGTHVTVTDNTDDVTLTTDATSSNTASTIVARDATGTFAGSLTGLASENVPLAGGTMTGNLVMSNQSAVQFDDTGSNSVTVSAPTTVSSSYAIALPATAPTVNQKLFVSSTNAAQTIWATGNSGAPPSVTGVIFVSPMGNDTLNNGSLDFPFQTLANAITIANGLSSMSFPVAIIMAPGIYTENNTSGSLTLTANGVSIIGATGFATTIQPTTTPNVNANTLLTITGSAWISNLQFNSNSIGSSIADGVDVNSSGNVVFKDVYIIGFNVGLSAYNTGTLVLENSFFTYNNTGVAIDGEQAAINTCLFQNGGTGTGISIIGSGALVGFTDGIFTGFSTAVSISTNAVVAMEGGVFKTNVIGCSISGAATLNATGLQFNLNNASGNVTNILISDAGTVVRCVASIFSNPSPPPMNQTQIAVQLQDEASATFTGGFVTNYTNGFVVGDDNSDTSGTSLLIGAVTVSNCTKSIIQQGTTTLSVQASNIDITTIQFNDETNVNLAYFDPTTNNRLNIGKYINTYPDTDLLMAETGRLSENPHIGYIPNIYGYESIGYHNESANAAAFASIAYQNDSGLIGITGVTSCRASLMLVSDTATPIGTTGMNSSLRGWIVAKNASTSELSFTFANSDVSDARPVVSDYIPFQIDGFNNLVQLLNGSKLQFASDALANLYWALSGTLQTDGNLIIGGLTANTALIANGSKQVSSSITTSTELGYVSGVTSAIQTQLNGKFSTGGGTLSGPLTIPAGTIQTPPSISTPSLTFTGSNTVGSATGLAAVANALYLITNGTYGLSLSPMGVVQIVNLTTQYGVVMNDTSGNLSSALITNNNIANLTITDAKLATISTAGKIATTALPAIITGNTSINGVTLSSLGSGFSVAGGSTSQTLTVSNTMTLQSNGATTLNIGATNGTLANAAFLTATNANTPLTVVERDGSGNFSAGTITANLTGNVSGSAASFTGSLSGDVTGTQSATVVSSVGGQTAANVASVTNNLVGLAPVLNSGTFTNTTNQLVLGTTKTTTINAPQPVTSSIVLNLPNTGDTLVGRSTTDALTNKTVNGLSLTSNTNGFTISGGTTPAILIVPNGGTIANSAYIASTNANTPSTIVSRDSSGNFNAGTITATLSGNATTATTSTNFTGSLAGDVTGTQGATVVSYVGGESAANVASATANVISGTPSFTSVTLDGTTSGSVTVNVAATVGGNYTITLPKGTTNFSSTGGSGQVVKQATAGGAFTVGQVSATTDLTGILPVVNGGTNSNAALNNNRMMLSSGGAIVEGGALNNGQFFIGSTGAAPAAGTITGTTNQITVTPGSNTIGLSLPQNIGTGSAVTFSSETLSASSNQLTLGNVNQTIISATAPSATRTVTIPDPGVSSSAFAMINTVTPPATGAILYGNGTAAMTPLQLTAGNNVTITSGGGNLTIAASGNPSLSSVVLNGSTSGSVTVGVAAIVGGNYTITLPKGTTDFSSTGGTSQVVKQTTSGGAFTVGQLTMNDITQTVAATVAQGGTNSSTALNNNRAMVSSGGAIVEAGAMTNGQLLIGSTSAAPVVANITGTTNQVNVTNGAGSIALSLPQNINTGATPTFASMILNNTTLNAPASSPVTLNLPNTATTDNIVARNTVDALTNKTVNGLSLTSNTTGFSVAGGSTTSKTLTVNNTLGLSGTDNSTLNIGAGGTLGSSAFLTATNANTASTVVERDASGNFSAGTITANLTGNASGSAASFTGNLVGDVTGTQGATVVSSVGGQTAANVASVTSNLVALTPSFKSVAFNGSTSGSITVTAPAVAGTNTLTLPAATDTLVGQSTTDTLNNKTLVSPVINGTISGTTVIPLANGGTGTGSTAGTTGSTSSNLVFSSGPTLTGNTTFTTSKYTTGDASQLTTTVTGTSTTFTSSMVGGIILFQGGAYAYITAFVSATSLTVIPSQTVSSQPYTLYYGGIQPASSLPLLINNPTITGNTILSPTSSFAIQHQTYIGYVAANPASQSGTTVTGSSTTFLPQMVGGIIMFTNNAFAFITAYVSATSLTVAQSQTVSSQGFTIYYGGLQADYLGNASVNNLYMPSLTASLPLQLTAGKEVTTSAINLTSQVTGVLPVSTGGTGTGTAAIGAFNNITGYTASGATGTTSTNLVFSTSPTITTPVINGVTNASAAAAGTVGEVISATLASGSAVTLANSAATQVTSISLTAGDWDVYGQIAFTINATTSALVAAINTSVGLPSAGSINSCFHGMQLTFTNGSQQTFPTGSCQINVSSTTTVYLVGFAAGTATDTAYGAIWARRRR